MRLKPGDDKERRSEISPAARSRKSISPALTLTLPRLYSKGKDYLYCRL